MNSRADILVVVPSTAEADGAYMHELIAFSRRLQELQGGRVRAVVVGADVEKAARCIAGEGGIDVTAVDTPGLSHYTNEGARHILFEEIRRSAPAYVCTGNTSQGGDWAPAVAARIGGACITAVTGIAKQNGTICFEKDLYGGKVKGRFVPRKAPCFLTLEPGIFTWETGKAVSPGKVQRKRAVYRLEQTRFLGSKRGEADRSNLAEAEVIVAAGLGIGDADNLGLIQRLADMIPKAVVAGTRIVCDRGWLEYQRQVGITGATVAPGLYIACGISGASQHVAGMRQSKFVIAVNTDPAAPIFNEADIGIVEDITVFIPMVEAIHGRREG